MTRPSIDTIRANSPRPVCICGGAGARGSANVNPACPIDGDDDTDFEIGDRVQYARDRFLLWSAETPVWTYDLGTEHDDDAEIIVRLLDEDEKLVDVCGCWVRRENVTVSDHGNVILDADDPFIVSVAAELARSNVAGEQVTA